MDKGNYTRTTMAMKALAQIIDSIVIIITLGKYSTTLPFRTAMRSYRSKSKRKSLMMP